MKMQRFNWRKLSLAAAAFTLALPAMAQTPVCNSISCTDKIGQLDVAGKPWNGIPNKSIVYVNVAHLNDQNNLSCTQVSQRFLTLLPDNPGYDQIFSLLQAYTIAGKPVTLRMNTGSPNCSIAYVVVTP